MHYAFIDALRGWAILAVILVHVSQRFGEGAPAFAHYGDHGQYGVQLFFVISALTLMLSWHRRDDGAAPFYIRRLFRIAPMFWLGIAGYTLLYGYAPRFWAPDGLTHWHVFATALFQHGWHPQTINSVVPGGWSIAVEVTFYAAFPLIVAWCTSLPRALVAVIAAIAVTFIDGRVLAAIAPGILDQPAILVQWYLYLWIWNQWPIFLLGVAAYFAMPLMVGRQRLGLVLVVVSVALAAACLLWAREAIEALRVMHLAYGACFALLALGLSDQPVLLLVNPLTRFVGKVSFSGYIWHFAVIEMLSSLDRLGPLALFTASTAITIALATATYYAIEKPCIRLGERVALPLARSRPAQPVLR